MNIYVVVEGKSEKKVYMTWIPYVNPDLTYVDHPAELEANQFAIVSSMGYPQYLEDVERAVEDVASNAVIDRLVVAIDSENMTKEEKYLEVEERIHSVDTDIEYRIVVQHFCLETWALGNRRVVAPLPNDAELKRYKTFYDVRVRDPEDLPPFEEWNRAKFAYQYLRRVFVDRWGSFTYSKSNPGQLTSKPYFDQLQRRLSDTGHIESFEDFCSAFS